MRSPNKDAGISEEPKVDENMIIDEKRVKDHNFDGFDDIKEI